jgi:diacylglycerol kinase (ATP)
MTFNTLFITNPLSGRKKRAEQIVSQVEKTYKDRQDEIQIWPVDFARLDEVLEEAIASGIRNIYAVGGDGTANAIGGRLVGKPVNFGVIPTGSGNGYARNIGFSIKPSLAIRQTIDAAPIRVDTAQINGQDFINIAGVGIGAEVAHAYGSTATRGLLPYLKSSIRSLFSYQAESYRLTIDGEIIELENILGIEVALGTQYGYEAKAAPLASLTDGLLDIVIIRRFPLIKSMGVVSKLFRGQVGKSRYIDFYQAKKVLIERQKPGCAQMDGEPFEAPAQLQVEVKELSLNLLLPNTLTPEKIDSL